MPRTKLLARSLLLATALVWGTTFSLVKGALTDCSPLLFNLLRMTLATAALIAVNHRHLRNLSRSQITAGALAGLFLAVGYQFQTLGLTSTTPAKSAFLTGLVVVFVPALTLVPAFRPAGVSRPGVATAAGALLAFAGLVLLTTPSGTRLADLAHKIGRGDLLTLACAVAFAAHLLTLARVAKGVQPGVLATLQIGFCTLFMLLTQPLEHAYAIPSARLLIALAVCGLLATTAAFTIQSFAQQVLPPAQTVLLLALEPVFAWLTSLLLLGQGLDRRALAGAGLILAAIALLELLPIAHTTELPA